MGGGQPRSGCPHGGDRALPTPMGLRAWGPSPYHAKSSLTVLDVTSSMVQCLLGHTLGLPCLLQRLPHRLSCAPHTLCP